MSEQQLAAAERGPECPSCGVPFDQHDGFATMCQKLSSMSLSDPNEWQPIGTAPKDRRILLWFPRLFGNVPYASVGKWDADNYRENPRPFWTCDSERTAGRNTLRVCPPTHWREIIGPNVERETP